MDASHRVPDTVPCTRLEEMDERQQKREARRQQEMDAMNRSFEARRQVKGTGRKERDARRDP